MLSVIVFHAKASHSLLSKESVIGGGIGVIVNVGVDDGSLESTP